MTFFTSDTHFGHRKVIRYCARPFLVDPAKGYDDDANLDVDAMDEAMIANWNATVKPEDTVYHLGDFALCSKERMQVVRARLNGTIHLILGNHDRASKTFYRKIGFAGVTKELTGIIEGLRVKMRHHPPARPTDEDAGFDLILCGHVHEKWKSRGKVINVGVDQWGFMPVTVDRLLAVGAL